MSVTSSLQIQKTLDPAVFQQQCKILFQYVLDDPTIQEHGSSGDEQQGVDILGRRRSRSPANWVGIQCKLTIKADKLRTGIVRKEASQAVNFQPPLTEYIIATTSDDVSALHVEAAKFTNEQAILGRDFTVQVWGWQTLRTHILQYSPVLEAFSHDAFPRIDEILSGVEQLNEKSHEHEALLVSSNEILQRLESKISVTRIQAWDNSAFDTVLDKQIDQYRDLVMEGRPKTALGLLTNLLNSLPADVDGRIKFRIKGNIAASYFRLGRDKDAGAMYLEAYGHDPENVKAAPLRMLGLMLLGDLEGARQFGTTCLARPDPPPSLITYLILAAKSLPKDDAIFQIIPPALQNDKGILIAQMDYLRVHNDNRWKETAKDKSVVFPDDENLTRYSAEAIIDDGCIWATTNGRAPLSSELYVQTLAAVSKLQSIWDSSLQTEVPWEDSNLILGANLATGYRLVNKYDEAKIVVDKGLQLNPKYEALLYLNLLISLERQDFSAASKLVKSLPQNRDTIVAQLQIYANEENWEDLYSLSTGLDVKDLGRDDLAFYESLVLLSKFRLGMLDDIKESVKEVLEKYADQVVAPIILHEIARAQRDRPWAKQLFETAWERRSSLNSASRWMLGRIADHQSEHAKTVDLLYGFIDHTKDSEDLRILTRAFVNAGNHPSSQEFIKSISEDLKQQSFYSRAIGGIQFNRGDLRSAEQAFLCGLASDPSELATHISLINTWLRQDRREIASGHLRELNIAKLKGAPTEKMKLCQLLVAFGFSEQALALGYEVALAGRDQIEVVQMYIGLLLPNPTASRIPSIGNIIELDQWIRAERSDGVELDFVIENGKNRPSINHYNVDHALSKAFIGQKRGATISFQPDVGSEQVWRIVEFKHKFLALLNEFTQSFNHQFPDATGFYAIQTRGNDITPILEEVKKSSEKGEAIFSNYLKHGYPISLAASLNGKSSVEFAGHVIARNEWITTCRGSTDERVEASNNVNASLDTGVILDTYTAWVAYSMGIVNVLKRLFKRVALPQTSIDELMEWRSRFEPRSSEPLMTMVYENGEYFRQEIRENDLIAAVSEISKGIINLRDNLEILPANVVSTPSDIEVKLTSLARYGFLNSIQISAAENLLLLSDDLNYRNIGNLLYGKTGAWLQVVLAVACDKKLIKHEEYSRFVCDLARQRHDHIALSARNLMDMAKLAQSDDMELFKAIVQFIGNAKADFTSHVTVSIDFLVGLWKSKDVGDLRKAKCTGILLERLSEMFERGGILSQSFREMLDASPSGSDLQAYLAGWLKGHFIQI